MQSWPAKRHVQGSLTQLQQNKTHKIQGHLVPTKSSEMKQCFRTAEPPFLSTATTGGSAKTEYLLKQYINFAKTAYLLR